MRSWFSISVEVEDGVELELRMKLKLLVDDGWMDAEGRHKERAQDHVRKDQETRRSDRANKVELVGLDVNHAVRKVGVDSHGHCLIGLVPLVLAGFGLVHGVLRSHVLTSPVTVSIRQEGRSGIADGARGTAHHVADIMGYCLNHIRRLPRTDLGVGKDFIVDNNVMGRTSRSLQGRLSLQIKLPIHGASDNTVNNSSIDWVIGSISIRCLGWIEADMVAFPGDDDSDLGIVVGNTYIAVLTNFQGY
jgi:hypothetical protein